MTIAVITGGRDRTPTLFELEQLAEVFVRRDVTVMRHGDCRGTDKAVAAWVKARKLAEVEAWPADWDKLGPSAGPRRNRRMLDGEALLPKVMQLPALEAVTVNTAETRPPASVLIHFRGGTGTADCTAAALERGVPVEWIVDADEPRPWNRHHGEPAGPSVYIGRGSPLGNPFPLEMGDGETRAQAADRILSKYRAWLWSRLRPGAGQDTAVVRALEQLTHEHYLVCSCWPAHCHAEVVIKAWRWARQVTETRQPSASLSTALAPADAGSHP